MNFNGEILNDFIAFTKHANEIAPAVPPMTNTQLAPVTSGQGAPRIPIMGTPEPKTLVSSSPKPATNTSKGLTMAA